MLFSLVYLSCMEVFASGSSTFTLKPTRHIIFNLLIPMCCNGSPSLGCPQSTSTFAASAAGIPPVKNHDFLLSGTGQKMSQHEKVAGWSFWFVQRLYRYPCLSAFCHFHHVLDTSHSWIWTYVKLVYMANEFRFKRMLRSAFNRQQYVLSHSYV